MKAARKTRFTRRELDALRRADDALKAARADPRPFAPLGAYARQYRTTIATIRKKFPGAVRMGPSNRLIANPGDRGRRIRPLVFDGEVGFVVVWGSRVAQRASRAWAAQYAFVRNPTDENEAALASLVGIRLGGQSVETDPETLLYLADAGAFGDLDLAEAYRELVG